jgi:hypothetical protein
MFEWAKHACEDIGIRELVSISNFVRAVSKIKWRQEMREVLLIVQDFRKLWWGVCIPLRETKVL